MPPAQRALLLAKLRLAAILAVMLLTPALTLLFVYDWDDLRRNGWRLLLEYLALMWWILGFCEFALYRLALRSASPARRTLDRLIAAFCVVNSGLIILSVLHPSDSGIAGDLLTVTSLFVVLSLCGLYWPLDTQSSQNAMQRLRLPKWLRRSPALLVAVAPLPLAIWLVHGDWLHAARHSLTSGVPIFVLFSLLGSLSVGMQWNDRTATQPPRVALSEADTAPKVEGTVTVAEGATSAESLQGPRDTEIGTGGVLISRTCATRRLGMDGDLWLFPDGLLRIPLGWPKTLSWVGNAYDPSRPVARTFDTGDFLHATTDPRNIWIARSDITSATLRRGIVYGELRATLNDGRLRRLV